MQPEHPQPTQGDPEGEETAGSMGEFESWKPIDFEGEDTSLTQAELALMK